MTTQDEEHDVTEKNDYVIVDDGQVDVTLLGEDAAAAAAGCGGGSTDSVSDAAESKPGCCGRPDESPLPETTVGIERVRGRKFSGVLVRLGKVCMLLGLLYLFICSLDLLSSAFRLVGGKAAGAAFSQSELLQNPIAGLMIGVLATSLVQSSSTSSSIVVTMVASGILPVRPAVPIIMGVNIGTSLTNTIVSLAQSTDREEFRRAFAGATVHDMFNWLTVIVLLPLEMATGYLYHLTTFLLLSLNVNDSVSVSNRDMLQTITKPLTQLIVQLDKKVIEGIAIGDATYSDKSLLKHWCGYAVETHNVTAAINTSSPLDINSTTNVTVPVKPCVYLFRDAGLSDAVVGTILLAASLTMLCGSLVLTVKLLNSSLRGRVLATVKRTVNADLPGSAAGLSGYVAMLIGAVLTIVVQSSSVFTSVLTPLVGVGVMTVERMYPLTLGANIGTTMTSVLAALASPADRLPLALQIALCHLLFNVSGIVLFYPLPRLRLPIRLAHLMGDTTARYRWFAVLYAVAMFLVIPLAVFALSMAGTVVLSTVVAVCLALASIIIIINALQRSRPSWLPVRLRSWDFLPLCLHSLDPADRVVTALLAFCRRTCCCREEPENKKDEEQMKEMRLLSPRTDNSKNVVVDVEELKTSNEVLPTTSDDVCEIVITESDSNSEKMMKEFALTLSTRLQKADDRESGYWSVTCTPAPSRLSSYVQLPQVPVTSDSVSCPAAAPSRLPSYSRLGLIVEAAVTPDDDSQNCRDTNVT